MKADSRSVLRVAYEAYERGDAVQARSLAQLVLGGKVGADDEAVAKELAARLSSAEQAVAESPAAVAGELVSRTMAPPKTYAMVAAIAAAFVALATLAALRY